MAITPLHEIHFEDLPPERLTYLHLYAGDAEITKDYAVISTLAVTDREVRSAMAFNNSKNILPLMGMMAVIEQLGEAYRRTDLPVYPHSNASSFKKALYYFHGQAVDDDFTKALYGLRNSIVHNASFYSVGEGRNPKHFIFTYDYNKPDVITPATTAWDGNFNNITLDYFTYVNPKELIKVMQKCMDTVKAASEAGKLEIDLAGGKNELIFRYFKWQRV